MKDNLTLQIFFRTVYIHNLKPEKSVAMAIVARYCGKSNQLQSVQGYGMHRTHKNICKPKKQKESDAMATLVASYCRKLISSNLHRGMECKELIKLFISSRNKKKSVAMATLVAIYCQKTSQLPSMQRFGMQRTHKKYLYIGKRNRKKVLPWQHLLPGIVEN